MSKDIGFSGNISNMHPEGPRIWSAFSNDVWMLYSNLRFSTQELVIGDTTTSREDWPYAP